MASKPFQASPTSRTAGRFVAANYGKWSLNVFSFPAGTGTLQFAVASPLAALTDGRQIIPFNTNAPIYVGGEKVTPSAVSNSSANPGGYLITATFSKPHGAGELISSASFGLQEALNDANASGGGAIVIDSSWAALGGTTTIKNAATVPSGTGIEDVRTGAPGGGAGLVASVASSTYSGTVSTGFTTFYTTLAAGNYRVCFPMYVTVAGTGTGNFQGYLTITADGHVFTPTVGTTVPVATQWAPNNNAGSSNCQCFYLDAGTVVRWALTPTGTVTTAPTLRYSLSLEYLNP